MWNKKIDMIFERKFLVIKYDIKNFTMVKYLNKKCIKIQTSVVK